MNSYLDVTSGGQGSLSTTWGQKCGPFTTPANAGKVRVGVYNYMNSSWAAFDDISLQPVATYTLTYDAENRLTTVKQGTNTIATFVYDGDGNRIKATVNGVTTAFTGNYLEWSNSAISAKYYYAGSQRVAMRPASGSLRWIVTDHLGSTSKVTDINGANPITTLYKPWGEVPLAWASPSFTVGWTSFQTISTRKRGFGSPTHLVFATFRTSYHPVNLLHASREKTTIQL